jgi:hypothetical protein
MIFSVIYKNYKMADGMPMAAILSKIKNVAVTISRTLNLKCVHPYLSYHVNNGDVIHDHREWLVTSHVDKKYMKCKIYFFPK